MSQIKDLQKSIHAWAIRKEWRGPKSSGRPIVADLMLFVSEIAEALEELRRNADPKHYWESWTATFDGIKFKNMTEDQAVLLQSAAARCGWTFESDERGKPEGVGPEFADLAIRLFETCEEYGIDLTFEIERKMAYNEGREIKHGGLLM